MATALSMTMVSLPAIPVTTIFVSGFAAEISHFVVFEKVMLRVMSTVGWPATVCHEPQPHSHGHPDASNSLSS